MKQQDLIKWQQGFQAAQERERALIRNAEVDCTRSIRLALSLIDAYNQQRKISPMPLRDCTWDRDVQRVRKQWVLLKKGISG